MPESKIWDGYYSVKDCHRHSNAIFVFGDNLGRHGYAGQAIIRDCTNAFGIPTCANINRPFTDKTYGQNCYYINLSLDKLTKKASKYDYIYFPSGGLGTGLAMLHSRAPLTYDHLNTQLLNRFGITNGFETKEAS